jgi:serine protease Do
MSMTPWHTSFAVALSFATLAPCSLAEASLQELLSETALPGRWIYKDIAAGTAEARKTGKPLLILFRCVPCQCAAELDKQIIAGGASLDAMLDKFVCVRVTAMNGVDVQRFQFDRDLSLAVLFTNADGTVYGRYGTRAVAQRTAMTHISLSSFLRSMERVLEMHRAFPAVKASLAGKQPKPGPSQLAEAMPTMRIFPGKQVVQNCIHCHMVGEAELEARRRAAQITPSDIWRFPLPETLGLRLETDHGLLVKTVRPQSPAAQAGLQPGDELISLAGQPLISQGDIQWALHHAPLEGQLPVEFLRGTQRMSKSLQLAANWKKMDMPWRESLNGARPGVVLENVSIGERQRLQLPESGMALRVRHVMPGPAKQLLRTGDVLLSANGREDFRTESDFLAYLNLTRPVIDAVQLKIARRGETHEVKLPLSETP